MSLEKGKPPTTDDSERHPRATEPATLLYTLLLSVVGAVIGMQILTTLGITPNTSIIGVLLAIILSRVPLPFSRAFRSIHRQNLLQTNISSATFGAANSLLMPIGIPLLIGQADLMVPMLIGATMGMLIDLFMLYWLFDSRLFPGSAPWPVGVAAAEAIIAGDRGGRRGGFLGLGALAGVCGSSGFFGAVGGVPMAAFGVAFIGNVGALTMFGVGLLLRAYSPRFLNLDLSELYVPHGVMIGAGLVALGQAVSKVMGREKRNSTPNGPTEESGTGALTRSSQTARKALVGGFLLYVGGALLLALVGGLWGDLSVGRFFSWIVFAAVACVAAEFIVGFAAMQAGWFPAFATALLFLVIALLLGFPPVASALLVGFVASGGPAFADAGYDFKTGWYLRGFGRHRGFELEGRREQVLSAAMGLLVGLVMVVLFHDMYFSNDLYPPVARVYATTLQSGVDPSLGMDLLVWAIPGALVQLLGGSDRQLGVLLGTGLLVLNAAAGWAVLAGIAVRIIMTRIYGKRVASTLIVFAAGCIAGDALWTFGDSVVKVR
jgi:uncharacterized oligopeptide transporter (OPT) family protein